SDALQSLGIQCTIIEKIADRVEGYPGAVIGDATRIEILKKAGVRQATTVIITTHEDETNVALTIYFRKLRDEWQILARSNFDRNVKTLSRAGADLVLSYASMGANTVFNLMRGGEALLLAEGLRVFQSPIPPSVAGRSLGDSQIRRLTACTVISVEEEGGRELNPGVDFVMPEKGRMFLVGTLEAEDKFLEVFHPRTSRRRKSTD
ncbi:MAG: TrkA family potassium uptake protein, partial [Guyparkeria sp.]